MKKLVFATNNENKIKEVKGILTGIEILSLKDINCNEDIPETGATLEENAKMKAEYVLKKYGIECFADDTGLEVEALNGEPGVHTARYAGEGHNSEANMAKLLKNLENVTNRKAQFRSVIALTENGKIIEFEGICKGKIGYEKKGNQGFGYDPIFIPDGYEQTYAELGIEIKNKISHRAKSVAKFVDYLKLKK